MYIIDKNKDFYDYFSHIYGEDKRITFDRRGSIVITDEMIATASNEYSNVFYPKDKNFVLLEVGNVQYLIKCFNLIFKDYPKSLIYNKYISSSMEIVRIFKDNKHYYNSPISIRGVNIHKIWSWKKGYTPNFEGSYKEVVEKTYKKSIDLPILSKTQLTSILDGKEIWIELQTYFSSLGNDKDVDIKMTDVDKAVNHGFDKKTSFRHPIK